VRIALAALAVVVLAACGSNGPAATDSPGVTGGPVTPSTSPLPALDSPAPSWRYPQPTPDADRVGALETALGGPVTVATDAPRSWSYAPPSPTAPANGGTDPTAIAHGIVRAIGLDPSMMTWTVSADGRMATGVEQLGGVPSPLPFVLTVDGAGAILTATGHLVAPTSEGDTPRIGTAAALGQLAGAAAGDDRGEQQPPVRPGPKPAVPPISPQPTTEPTVVDRLLRPPVAVAATYVQAPAPDGGGWLLPAYRFTFDDGSTRTVMAVARTPDASPIPDATGLVGLPEDQAAAAAASHGWGYRVAERDGASQLLTADYDPNRANVAVTTGTVTRAWMG
jgi:hypothetical protein